MAELFETKVRAIGTSFGVLIPIDIVRSEKLKQGDEIMVSVLRKNLKLLKESFGIAKGAGKFVRDRTDRLERLRNAS